MKIELVLSIFSIVLALTSLIWTTRLRARQVDLQVEQVRLQRILAAYKVTEDSEKRASKASARIDARVLDQGRHRYKILIENVGQAVARNVRVEVALRPGQDTPFVGGDFDVKLPIKELQPGDACPLIAAFCSGAWPPYDISATWDDPDGTSRTMEKTLFL